jgi:hypothetical protein
VPGHVQKALARVLKGVHRNKAHRALAAAGEKALGVDEIKATPTLLVEELGVGEHDSR